MASLKADKPVGTQLFGQVKKEPVKTTTTSAASKAPASKPAPKKAAPKPQEPKRKVANQQPSSDGKAEGITGRVFEKMINTKT
ncbi:hypothetical protein RJ639_005831 [Escallonia herrerae]|uniref:Uncharacterized protein n=1 Tax=Escallonia herrerae TaxID=1293975 RepID=A0AA88VX48_9ASTE|nr:hypothetical protein RJ639_005831 [Escallonia herrerae]